MIGYLPEHPPLYAGETPEEYLRFVGEAKGVKGEELQRQVDEVIRLTGIDKVKDRLISALSKGYCQRVGIAQALIGNPEIIILDEPTVGLDPIQIIDIRELIRELGKTHTVIFSSHILSEVQSICEQVLIISKGTLAAFDAPDKLVMTNILVSVLPPSMTKPDISASKLYSITSNTKTVVNALDKDVTIYWIVQADKENSILENLLSKYDSLSEHIKVEKKNPDAFPTFAEKYTKEKVKNNSLVVECGDRSRYISIDDIYISNVNYNTYTASHSFDGEGAVTSAIDYVVSEKLPKVYVLEGHGEKVLPAFFVSQMEKDNVERKSISLINQDSVPLTAAFEDINQIDVSLDGNSYRLFTKGTGSRKVWHYKENDKLDTARLQEALTGLRAESFTTETPGGKEELSLTVHLDNKNHPEVSIRLYRYDGERCLAVINVESVSLVPRSSVVSLTESIYSIVLKKE